MRGYGVCSKLSILLFFISTSELFLNNIKIPAVVLPATSLLVSWGAGHTMSPLKYMVESGWDDGTCPD